MFRLWFVIAALVCASCGDNDTSYSPTSPSPPPTTPPPPSQPPPPSYPAMSRVWNGTQIISAAGQSSTCPLTWLIAQQTEGAFSGTWQASGTCGSGGTLNGTVTLAGAVRLAFETTVGAPVTCDRVGGDSDFTGAYIGDVLTAQRADVMRCPGTTLGDINRISTISMR